MRAYQFLLEYDRSREQQRIESLPAYEQRIKQEPEFSLERLESGDPTPQKIYVPRLAQWWLAGEPIEDLISTTADALEKYHTLKNKKLIKPEHADIGRFKTADQFIDMISQYQLPQDKPQEVDRGKYKEIFRDAELLVVQLLDETAAKFWGQSTKWCTAAKKNNMFSTYAKRGPLFVIIPRKDPVNKYQYWFSKLNPYEMQFKNVEDREYNPQNLPFFSKLQKIMHPLSQHIMWNENPSKAEQLAAVKETGGAIEYIKNPSEAVQRSAVKRNGWAIAYIENPSEAMQLTAVKQYGQAIRYIKNPSPAVELAAVQQDGWAIEFIENPSEAVQLTAVRQNGTAIEFIKNPSKAVQLAAVRQDGLSLQFIENPTPAVQLAAVKQDKYAFEFVKNPSEEMLLAAVKRNGWLIQFIKNPSEAVQLAAVQQDAQTIKYIKNPTPRVQALAKELGSTK